MPFHAASIVQHVDKWRNIVSDRTVLHWVDHGVPIPFTDAPNQGVCLPNHQLTKQQCAFVDTEISELLLSGAIEHCTSPLHVSPLGVVPKKTGKKNRLIVDLRSLNESCKKTGFQYEDIKTVSQLIQPDDSLVTLDIKNGFHHVLIDKLFRDYLAFRWRGVTYRWKVLPFGLSASPWYFGKILRPIFAHLRSLGIRVCCYVDDILILAKPEQIKEHSNIVINTLVDLGWSLNWEKCSAEPSQEKVFLGFVLDTSNGEPIIRVPNNRIRKLRKDITRLLHAGSSTARVVARICGQCVAMFRAIAPGKLMLRNVYKLLAQRSSWDSIIDIDSPAKSDLQWWYDAVVGWNGNVIAPKPADVQITTDASHIGYGAVCMGKRAAGFWPPRIANLPSNDREMWAVLMALHTFGGELVGKAVRIVTDNVSTMVYINKLGGSSQNLTALAKDIWMVCNKFNITLSATFLAGCLNVEADWLSCLPEQYECALNPMLFNYINLLWGPHSVDRFATMSNTQLSRFNSRFWDPQSEGVDALSQQNWQREYNYVNAPFRLLPQIIDKLVSEKAWATIIAPRWVA